jgi:hypothetical protein
MKHYNENTLEQLEKIKFTNSSDDSFLVSRCQSLYKKQLKNYTTEDLRIMIGQQIGLDYLIPLAIEKLKSNLFIEGDYYEGDLLKAVLSINPDFWNTNKECCIKLNDLLLMNKEDDRLHPFHSLPFFSCKY